MNKKILFIDDDLNLLKSVRRILKREYDVQICNNPVDAVDLLKSKPNFSVIVSDYKMPQMNGVELLKTARESAPNSTRILLTGFADIEIATEAINTCDIFRLLIKPCGDEDLKRTLEAAARQHQLLMSEKELLHGTLRGAIGVLKDTLYLVKPRIADFSERIQPLVKRLNKEMCHDGAWAVDIAADLCLLGYINLPDSTIKAVLTGRTLSNEQFLEFRKHSDVAQELLAHIPRFGEVVRILKYQDKQFNGMGIPEDDVKGGDIPVGARIIKIVKDYDLHLLKEKSPKRTLAVLEGNTGCYDPGILKVFKQIIERDEGTTPVSVKVDDLQLGMTLLSDIYILLENKKVRALARGAVITEETINKLNRLKRMCTLSDIVQVKNL